jgi:hypothetical protein
MSRARNTLLALFATVAFGLASVAYATAVAVQDARVLAKTPPKALPVQATARTLN